MSSIGQCEGCGWEDDLRAFGMDGALLCPTCFARAERNYEGAVRALNPHIVVDGVRFPATDIEVRPKQEGE